MECRLLCGIPFLCALIVSQCIHWFIPTSARFFKNLFMETCFLICIKIINPAHTPVTNYPIIAWTALHHCILQQNVCSRFWSDAGNSKMIAFNGLMFVLIALFIKMGNQYKLSLHNSSSYCVAYFSTTHPVSLLSKPLYY